jgi:SAM-dependent methyltransferase
MVRKSPVANDYLAYAAWRGDEYLHPGGRPLTEWLVPRLGLSSGGWVLEIGIGLGATASLVVERTGATVVRLDRLPAMLDGARCRAAAASEHIVLVRADAEVGLPFRDASFDAVYAESVLGILDFERILPECERVLRPGGVFVANDGIWRPGLSPAEVDAQNAWTLQSFGIRAGSPRPHDHDGWVAVIERAGLAVTLASRVDALGLPPSVPGVRPPRRQRMLRYAAQPGAVLRRLRFDRRMRQGRRYTGRMETWVFVARKPAWEFPTTPQCHQSGRGDPDGTIRLAWEGQRDGESQEASRSTAGGGGAGQAR